jgi:hypothetical protein
MTAAEPLCAAGWAACLSAGATIAMFVMGTPFFSVGQPWGTINDAAGVLRVLLQIISA